MVKTKLAALLLAAALCVQACGPRMTWERVPIDGHLTGVSAVTGEDVAGALGSVEDSSGIYHAPCGRTFEGGATPLVASAVISYQPYLRHLKEVIGFCPEGLDRGTALEDGLLTQWTADALVLAGEAIYHMDVDLAIINRGGIRLDMPKGEVLLDDILGMFPFRNDIVCLDIRGCDLEELFRYIASSGKFSFSGARIEVKDRELQSLTIGGEPIDRERIYHLVTVDFLLTGGDGMEAGKNALDIRNAHFRICDWMVPYIRTAYAGGAVIGQVNDGRYKQL